MGISPYEFTSNISTLLPDPQKKSPGLTALLIFAAGSGGMITTGSAIQASKLLHLPHIKVEQSSTRRIEVYAPSEQVATIKNALGLNISEMASILNVTRPTIYAWLSGQQEPKQEALTQIHKLHNAAKAISIFSIQRVNKLIRRPLFEGQSLIDKIKAGDDLLAPLAAIKALADKEKRNRLTKKGSGKSRRPFEAAISDHSSGVYDQDK